MHQKLSDTLDQRCIGVHQIFFVLGSSCWLRVRVRMRVGVVGRTSVRRSCGNCQFFSILSSILYARLTNFPQNLILFYEVEKRFIKEVLIFKIIAKVGMLGSC